jgi:hypothetical protein
MGSQIDFLMGPNSHSKLHVAIILRLIVTQPHPETETAFEIFIPKWPDFLVCPKQLPANQILTVFNNWLTFMDLRAFYIGNWIRHSDFTLI